MQSPLVSICLPSLNTASFIEARIASIDTQTVKEVEVIVLDSFSNDGTWEALQRWAGTRERVIAKQIPRGLYQAWNQCLAIASGRWLYFATSDDFMAPNCLQRLVGEDDANGADVVTSDEWIIDAKGNDLPSQKSALENRLLAKAVGKGRMIYGKVYFLSGLLFGTPTASITQMAIHRSVFEQGGGFPTEFGSFGDYCWQMKALLRFRWRHLPERLGAWRVYEGQATPTDVQKRYDARARIVASLWQEGHFPHGIWFKLASIYVAATAQPASAASFPSIIRFWATLLRRCPRLVRSAWRQLLCLPPQRLLVWLVES